MSTDTSARWLVTYDITDRRKLVRVFRLLKKNGIPVQYSVFLVYAPAVEIGSLMARIARLIDSDTDDVRAYRLPENTWRASLGATILPEDVWMDARGRL